MALPNLEQLLEHETPLLSLPTLVIDLIALLDKPTVELGELEALISGDAALSARVLQVVNSAWFALPAQVESIAQALGMLGMERLRSLVLATKVAELFSQVPGELIDIRRFWENSYISATLAADMAHTLDLDRQRLYTAGLLHHLGLMVMLQRMPGTLARLMIQSAGDEQELYRQELSLLGYSHAEVGAALMRRWQLPEVLAELCAYHHDFYQAPRHASEAAVLHLADALAQGISPLMQVEGLESHADLAVFNYLPLDGEGVKALEQHARRGQLEAGLFYP